MAVAPNSTVLTGPNFQQQDASTLLITPTGGSQASMADVLGGKAQVPLLNAGTVTAGVLGESVLTGITASVTQTLVGAVALTAAINVVSKVGTAGDAVRLLPAGSVGLQQTVINNGASAMAVFPGEAGTKIDGGSAGASVTLTNAKNATFINTGTADWVSFLGGAKSS